MRSTTHKTLAILMVIVTTIGLLLGLFFIIQVWRCRPQATEKLQSIVNQTSITLNTTDVGIEIIERVINNVYTSTLNLSNSTESLAATVQSTGQFIDSAGDFMGGSLINTITNTQTAMESAQASAVVIDNILVTLSKVPFIGINYNPNRPLNVALGEVAESFDPLQSNLKNFQGNLTTAQMDMQEFGDQLLILNQNITSIQKNLEAIQIVIVNYQSQVDSLISWSEEAILLLPKWTNSLAWILTAFIFWMMLIQAGIMFFALQQINSVAKILETS